jgi:hypothetical protein
MWIIHNLTGEQGWHICQENQKEPCGLAVFVKDSVTGNAWKLKLWPSQQTSILAKNCDKDMDDQMAMRFPLKN